MKYLAYSVLGLAVMMGVNSAYAAGDIKAGKIKSAICATCHGSNGKATMPNYPNLAGQNEAYLVSALKSYRSKQRNGGMASVMQMQAANLSDQDIENLAAYFSSLKP